MKGFGKRLCALVVCILMICLQVATVFAAPMDNCPGNCTHAAAIGTTHYDTLAEAIDAAVDHSTVILLTDVTVSEPLTIAAAITLDLGQKTLSCTAETVDSFLTVTKDLILRNGKVTTVSGLCVKAADCSLTIEDTSVLISETGSAVLMSGAGKLTVNGGTFQAKEHILVLDVSKDKTMTVSIAGGTFTSEKEPFLINKEADATAPEKFVTGGTFNQNPSAYIANQCAVTTNGSNYTVVTSYTIAFQANGGSGSMQNMTVTCGSSVTLPKCGFTAPKNMDFAGWKIGSKTYAAGDTYTPAENVTVIALWKAHVHSGGKATCVKKAVCSICGASYGKLASHKITHISAYDPTCTASGMTRHDKCSVCNTRFVSNVIVSTRSVTLPALGHTWEEVAGIPATCEEAGIQAHQKCADCGALRVDGESVKEDALVIPAGEHVLETVAAVESTCKETGMIAHEQCSACGQLFQEGQPVESESLSIPTIAHVLSDWANDQTEHWKSCISCGEVFRQKAHADADLDGACNDCGYAMAIQQETAPAPQEEQSGFNWLFLVPIAAAVGIAVPLATKKRK